MRMSELIQEEKFSSDEELSDGSESSGTDIDANIANEEIFDEEFFKCYSALRRKDKQIYDKNLKFFRSETSESLTSDSKTPKLPEMSIIEHNIKYQHDEPNIRPKSLYEKELEEIKEDIVNATKDLDDDDDQLFIAKKPAERPKVLDQVWNDQLSEDEKFLRDYIVNKLYIPKSAHFSENLDNLSDVEDEKKHKKSLEVEDHQFEAITRVPRHSTKTIRDLVEKKHKKERRTKRARMVKDDEFKFHYNETDPSTLTAEEILMSVIDEEEEEEEEKEETNETKEANEAKMKKKKKKRGKKIKSGVAPDRLLSYGLTKSKLKKFKLLK